MTLFAEVHGVGNDPAPLGRVVVQSLGTVTSQGQVGVSEPLLRQPHGFEGFRVVPELFNRKDLALADREDVRHFDARFRPVSTATPDAATAA
jgi:hypothetical protein